MPYSLRMWIRWIMSRSLRDFFAIYQKQEITPYKNTWKPVQDTVCWCNLMLAQQRGLQFYQTRSHAVILYDTLPAEFIEKAMCMKSNVVDCRVPGISLSTAQQQDEQRQHTVAKLIEKFESHRHKEQFLKDMSQTQKINRFSKASRKIATRCGPDVDLLTLWEFYETSMLRLQLLHGNRNNLLQLWTQDLSQ